MKIAPLSGFPEWLPDGRIVEQRILDTLRHTFEVHGFSGIETRAVEPLDQLLLELLEPLDPPEPPPREPPDDDFGIVQASPFFVWRYPHSAISRNHGTRYFGGALKNGISVIRPGMPLNNVPNSIENASFDFSPEPTA